VRSSCLLWVLAGVLLGAMPSAAQSDSDPAPETISYSHDGLKLQAYLFRPQGSGPFPMVVYNHGSRPGEERVEWSAPFVARLLVPQGYAVLVPERRGYGKSEGAPFSEEIGEERGARYVERLKAETGDALAAFDHVANDRTSHVDPGRAALMGYSFGGIVATLGAAGTTRFRAVIVQAPGALSWPRSTELQAAMKEAASRIRVPIQCVVAQNDATTESARAVCDGARAAGSHVELKIYPPFTPRQPVRAAAAGHALFSPIGASVWGKDLIAFLAANVKPPR
jgi:dienelactone hydrolase